MFQGSTVPVWISLTGNFFLLSLFIMSIFVQTETIFSPGPGIIFLEFLVVMMDIVFIKIILGEKYQKEKKILNKAVNKIIENIFTFVLIVSLALSLFSLTRDLDMKTLQADRPFIYFYFMISFFSKAFDISLEKKQASLYFHTLFFIGSSLLAILLPYAQPDRFIAWGIIYFSGMAGYNIFSLIKSRSFENMKRANK